MPAEPEPSDSAQAATGPESSWDDADYAALDPNALDPDALGADGVSGAGGDELDAIGESQAADPEEMERWNSPGLVEDLSEQLPDLGAEAGDLGAEASVLGAEASGPGAEPSSERTPQDRLVADAANATVDPVDANDAVDLAGRDEADAVLEAGALEQVDASLATAGGLEPPAGKAAGRTTAPMLDDAPPAGSLRKVLGAVPISLGLDGIEIDVEVKGKMLLPFDRIEAVAVGAARDLGPKPVVLIDLVLNWGGDPRETLRVLRIRSDRFDPRGLAPGAESGVDALRSLTGAILDAARPVCLPDEAAVRGEPFAIHDTVAAHERATIGEAPG